MFMYIMRMLTFFYNVALHYVTFSIVVRRDSDSYSEQLNPTDR